MVWEAGGLDTRKQPPLSNSLICADANGEKLKIAFDTNPRENITQCAFFAEIGHILAACYINQVQDPDTGSNSKSEVTLELARIQQLTTTLVQGEARASCVLQTLWVHREVVPNDQIQSLVNRYDLTKDGHREEFKTLLGVALEKAVTPLNEQRFFWAIPRNPSLKFND